MIDRLHLCHTVEFAERATIMPYTPLATDLLLSKLQIVEFNAKDLDETVCACSITFALEDSDDPPTSSTCAWAEARRRRLGLVHYDLAFNLRADPGGPRRRLRARSRGPPGWTLPGRQTLLSGGNLEQPPKSRRWKLRDCVGERKRWYEIPGGDAPPLGKRCAGFSGPGFSRSFLAQRGPAPGWLNFQGVSRPGAASGASVDGWPLRYTRLRTKLATRWRDRPQTPFFFYRLPLPPIHGLLLLSHRLRWP